MPKISLQLEYTVEEAVTFLEQAGPIVKALLEVAADNPELAGKLMTAHAEIVKAMWKLAGDNPEMFEQLGAMQAAYSKGVTREVYRGVTQEMFGRQEAAPVWPMMEMFNQWVALVTPKI